MRPLKIGKKLAQIPIIQGGMGVGVSLGRLAGAVAKEGAVGIISSAQIGFYKEGFEKDQAKTNLEALKEQITLAKDISEGNGLVGVNVMVALKHYEEHVKASVAAGADLIISGAGLPMKLPEYVEGSDTAIAPIVSTERCTRLILRRWEKSYNRYPDMIVIEGPKAGGHLGFTKEEATSDFDYDSEISAIIETVSNFEKTRNCKIPVIVAGGVFDASDIAHAISLGASGVQMATRFVATEECDASKEYKEAYINATKDQIQIIQSPVGMPGRALKNAFLEHVYEGKQKITKCYQCLAHCNPAEIPYCITDALIKAVRGDVDNGLIFCGDNVDRINKIVSVHELISELVPGFNITKITQKMKATHAAC